MGEVIIRPALLEDAPGIARVHVDAWREAYRDILPLDFLHGLSYESREQQARRYLSDPSSRVRSLVAQEQGGPIVGFVSVGPERGEVEEYDGELYAIYLLQKYQGAGYGRALFARGARSLADDGFTSMVLWVLAANPARGFYEHLGGTVAGEKLIDVGGQSYPEVAYGWPRLSAEW